MALADLIQKSSNYVGDHSTTILTVMGVSGVITTAVLTGKASVKAHEILKTEEEKRVTLSAPELTTVQKVKIVWPIYIPPVVMGSTTIAAIIMSNQIASKKITALAIASGISERAFQEYKAKVIEKVGSVKETAVRDEIAQDRVNKYPVNTREVIIAGTGEVLCFDMNSGRYFQSSVEEIRQAQNKFNQDIINHMYASLSAFYDMIELPPTVYSDTVGWNSSDLLEVKFSTVMSADQRPCIAIDFEPLPKTEYANLY